MAILIHFFCKMYFLYVSGGRKKEVGRILVGFTLPKKGFFSSPWAQLEFFRNCGAHVGGTLHFLKNDISNEMIINSNKSS